LLRHGLHATHPTRRRRPSARTGPTKRQARGRHTK
jgi:hypothetical protein